jgi:hypothetical protein
VSAVLLFSLQPIVARAVIPPLGGSPAVWTACVLFFQAVLLVAYLYAHLLSRVGHLALQAAVHLAVLGAAAALMPASLAGASSRLSVGSEAGQALLLLQVLAATVGPVAFGVSATGPLVQHWLMRAGSIDPYYVYAFSNAGSLGALLAYPALIEPATNLGQQFRWWGVGFWAFAALMAATAAVSFRSAYRAGLANGHKPRTANRVVTTVTLGRRVLWIALAAVPSSLMLGVTAYLSTDIAAVPLLWVVPCALYLATLIVPFSGIGPAAGRRALALLPIVVLAVLSIQTTTLPTPTVLFMALHVAAFVRAALACHTVLVAMRPDGRHLTEYYVCVAVGGVLGGAVNSLLAPWLFRTVAEYPLMLIAGLVLPTWAAGVGKRPGWRRCVVAAALAIGVIPVVLLTWNVSPAVRMLLLAGVPLAFCFAARHPGLQAGVVLTLLLVPFAAAQEGRPLHVVRSFFGVHRVLALDDGSHVLQHGTTIHGRQMWADETLKREPGTYYYRGGPFGDLDTLSAAGRRPRRVGVAGLGGGALAAYARPEDRWTFYEIDPAVERIARNPAFFTHLSDCGRSCSVVLGDARISLRAEPLREFDLLAFDVFSSDAIPVHMLTAEAIAEYRARLGSGGVMAFHISNRYLDLAPVLARGASEHGLSALIRRHRADGVAGRVGGLSSDWMVMAESPATLAPFASRGWTVVEPAARPWTDDFSNVLAVVRWRGRGTAGE